jgi:uncharacterized protein YecE (DUF72 family)
MERAGDAHRVSGSHRKQSIATSIVPRKPVALSAIQVDMLAPQPYSALGAKFPRASMPRSHDKPSTNADSSAPTSGPPPATASHEIRVGPAGWSYPDWAGYVYPSPRPKAFHPATYLAQFFDTIEINTSFYAPLRPDHARQWLDRVSANPRFLFTAKLWQKLTHDPFSSESVSATRASSTTAQVKQALAALARPADVDIVRAGFEPLASVGKLGAILLQFPFSFHRTDETTAYLSALLNRFSDYPLAVEVRHASWNHPELFALLREHRTAFCNIDQPIIGRSLEPSAESTSPIGYVRLHGRRYDTWFSDDAAIPSHERYNYLYSAEELAPWTTRIRTVAEKTRNVFVVTNNHYLGKAVVNALQLISLLRSSKVPVPEPLRQHYPELEAIASEPPAAPTLFLLGKEVKR